jgi:hypothetical protein
MLPPSIRFGPASILAFLLVLAVAPGAVVAGEPEPAPHRSGPIVISPGERGQTSLFGIRAEGSKFVYVLDRSGSMGGSGAKALAAAKTELLASIQKLDRVHQFQIIFYNERPRNFNPTGQAGRLAFGTDQNKSSAARFIDTINAEGGTDHEEALVLATRLRPDVIFLLTDADDPKLNARQLERIDRMGAGVIINTIEFGTGPQREAENFLVKLARQSGGQHAYVDVAKLGPERSNEH